MKKKILFICISIIVTVNSLYSQCPDYLDFSTQQQIDEFPVNYPNCSEIDGFLIINGDDINSLIPLSEITSVNSYVFIYQTSLVSLSGLNNLTRIGGYLVISNNNNLVNLVGLNNLDTVSGYISINNNVTLSSLIGLENLSSIEEGSFGITLNESLVELTSFDNLHNLISSLYFENNASLTSLSGLESLNTVQGSVSISNCPNMEDLSGLSGLEEIGQDLILSNLYFMENIDDLSNLTSIEGSLKINKCNTLENFSGLSGLSTIGGSLEIIDNNMLASLDGLDNINAESIENLIINFNPLLTTCHVQSVCSYIADPNGDLSIHSNWDGCNNYLQVEEACLVNIDESLDIYNQVVIYPNPATNQLFIRNEQKIQINSIILYNKIGQEVLVVNNNTNQIDVSNLNSGIYFVKISTDFSVINKVLVIN